MAYGQILNFDQSSLSKLSSLFLVGMINSNYFDDESYDKLILPIFEMIQKVNNIENCPYYLSIEYFVGDTPALQSLGGFIEAVGNANFPCRECMVEKIHLSKISEESKCNMRTKEGTISQARRAVREKKSVSGVKRLTKLMSYDFFDPITMCPQDPMHVILEGIGRRLVIDFLKLWVERDRTTITEINSRITTFKYGYLSKKVNSNQYEHLIF